MRHALDHSGPISGRNCKQRVELIFDRHVFTFMTEELARHHHEEDGGKYIGYLLSPSEARPGVGHADAWRIVIVDFLPGGPNARRSQVEFMPDGAFQEDLFRRAERRDQDIEHIGTWHSHHCNGLATLSGGDVRGYFATVNKQAYRPNFFVASLVKTVPRNSNSVDWIDHFLFVRGEDRYYDLTSDVQVLDIPTSFGDLTGHRPASAERTRVAPRNQSTEGGRVVPWYETDTGRAVLGEDKKFFAAHFGDDVRASRTNGQIKIKGGRENVVSVTYPLIDGQQELDLEVSRNSKRVLSMKFDLEDRVIAYQAALSAQGLLNS
jgi:hypothetical protein